MQGSRDERGEYSYFGSPSQLATLQAVPRRGSGPFPIAPRKLSVAEPRLSCGARLSARPAAVVAVRGSRSARGGTGRGNE